MAVGIHCVDFKVSLQSLTSQAWLLREDRRAAIATLHHGCQEVLGQQEKYYFKNELGSIKFTR